MIFKFALSVMDRQKLQTECDLKTYRDKLTDK